MIALTRRAALGATAIVPLVLAGCATGAGVPQIIVTYAVTMATGLSGMFTQLEAAYPSLVPASMAATIAKDLAIAKTAATSLSTSLPAGSGALTVRTILGDVNAVLALAAGPPINGLIPAPFNQAVAAVSLLAPTLEAFVESFFPATAGAPLAARQMMARLSASAHVTSQAQALAILQKFGAS